MEVERDPTGDLLVRALTPLHVDTLLRVPEWLRSEDPRVRDRLLPPVYEDDERQREWKRLAGDELDHLFASRCELIEKDLRSLEAEDEMTFTLAIQNAHAPAWLSGLNGARLALFALHELDADDLEADPADIDDLEKELVLVRIHIMAFLQEMLIEAGV